MNNPDNLSIIRLTLKGAQWLNCNFNSQQFMISPHLHFKPPICRRQLWTIVAMLRMKLGFPCGIYCSHTVTASIHVIITQTRLPPVVWTLSRHWPGLHFWSLATLIIVTAAASQAQWYAMALGFFLWTDSKSVILVVTALKANEMYVGPSIRILNICNLHQSPSVSRISNGAKILSILILIDMDFSNGWT